MQLENTREVSRETYKLYKRAIKENTKLFRKRAFSSKVNNYSGYWMVDKDLNLIQSNCMDISRKTDDILAAIPIGALIIYAQHGDDAIIPVRKNTVEFVELKLSLRARSDCWFSKLTDDEVLKTTNPRFTIYVGDSKSSNPASFKSSAGGTYEIINNVNSKNRSTYFVLFDKETYELIDVRKMTGETVMNQLGKSEARKRFISYNQFLEMGEDCDTILPKLGYETWAEPLVEPERRAFMERRATLLRNLPPKERLYREKLDRKNIYSLSRRRAA